MSSILLPIGEHWKRNKLIWNLWIGNRVGLVVFLSGIMPYLQVKKVLAQDVIRFFRLFPKLKPGGRPLTKRDWRQS